MIEKSLAERIGDAMAIRREWERVTANAVWAERILKTMGFYGITVGADYDIKVEAWVDKNFTELWEKTNSTPTKFPPKPFIGVSMALMLGNNRAAAHRWNRRWLEAVEEREVPEDEVFTSVPWSCKHCHAINRQENRVLCSACMAQR